MRGIILSVIAVIVLAYAVREALYIGARRNKIGEYDKLNTIFLKSNNYEALFLGSSRAESHYNTKIIDSITSLNSYNCGLEGATMPFIYSALKAYLVNSKAPKYIFLNVDYFGHKEEIKHVHRFPRYFPYLSNPELYKGLKARDDRFPYFRWIPFYSMPYYNQKYLNASMRGFTGYQSEFDKGYVQGYAPLPKLPQIMMDTVDYFPFSISPPESFYQSLDSISTLCKTKDITLVFTCSPLYEKEQRAIINEKKLAEKVYAQAKKNGITVLNYTSIQGISTKNELFNDPYHLNHEGSRLFSLEIAAAIGRYLGKQDSLVPVN